MNVVFTCSHRGTAAGDCAGGGGGRGSVANPVAKDPLYQHAQNHIFERPSVDPGFIEEEVFLRQG